MVFAASLRHAVCTFQKERFLVRDSFIKRERHRCTTISEASVRSGEHEVRGAFLEPRQTLLVTSSILQFGWAAQFVWYWFHLLSEMMILVRTFWAQLSRQMFELSLLVCASLHDPDVSLRFCSRSSIYLGALCEKNREENQGCFLPRGCMYLIGALSRLYQSRFLRPNLDFAVFF